MATRAELEAKLAEALGKVHQEALDAILKALGDPPKIEHVTQAMWDEIATKYRSVFVPILTEIFLSGVQEILDTLGGGVDWAAFNTRAAEWASSYSFELVRGINDTSREALQKAVSDFYTHNLTMDDLRTRLTATFGPVRADLIAVTETTRAKVEGDRALTDELKKQGALLKGIIETSMDDRVCAICGPKQGKDPETEGYPPFHVYCRCYVNYTPAPYV